ncbi:histone deacetylase HDT1-like isoform X2 [Andrographis paniculata]|uniref:histone deacetylase HDT1-like isoform X2 n=1 Tax=Andrographis paniculata TaxID=175694 RepID=UPI0021E7C17D|nr:histone deacetylase HDT1-like isoform X2 [Andrographis paniculata]
MEFWGVEVKSGETLKVKPGDGMVLHLSQACLGELKKEKGNESVCLSVDVDGKKLVLGTLFSEKLPQQQFDLVFDRDFELSHNWKAGCVYFYGYKASNAPEEEMPVGDSDSSDSEEEDIPLTVARKPEPKAKPDTSADAQKAKAAKDSDTGKQKVKIVEPKKDEKPEEDDSSDDDSMSEDDDDDDDSEDEDDSEDDTSEEETPKKDVVSKKRAPESATKTPVQSKKAKVTPQKTDGKKAGGHVDTPHPAKQAGKKTPANKPNQESPKSGGHSCKSCNKTFGSEKGLESHTKAKHGK